jgi:hypothetical protein
VAAFEPGEQYFKLYEELMVFWKERLPERIYDVRYENLVQEPERVGRALLAHCGLAWDKRVLQFDETKRSVHTASSVQVRQPLYILPSARGSAMRNI